MQRAVAVDGDNVLRARVHVEVEVADLVEGARRQARHILVDETVRVPRTATGRHEEIERDVVARIQHDDDFAEKHRPEELDRWQQQRYLMCCATARAEVEVDLRRVWAPCCAQRTLQRI